MKIAILGGSFDPPHKGHLIIANHLLKLLQLDQVWLMPCYRHPFNKTLSSPKIRLTMTKLLESKKVKVSDLEIKLAKTNYTIDTLKLLVKKYPKDEFFWVIGTDQLGSFTKWKSWQEIINKFKLIIVPRTAAKKAGLALKNICQQVSNLENIILIDRKKFPSIYISSTLIRKRIKEKKFISNLVPKKIEKYIIKSNLYK